MTNEILRFKEIIKEMEFEKIDLSNMLEKCDQYILRGEIDFLLNRQGFSYTSKDVIDSFSLYKLNEMIKNNINLIDMDRWNIIEGMIERDNF